MKIKTTLISEVKKAYPLVALGQFEGEKEPSKKALSLGGEIEKVLRRLFTEKIATGKAKESFIALVDQSPIAGSLLTLGLGNQEKLMTSSLREIGAGILQEIKKLKAQSAAVLLASFPGKNLSAELTSQVLTEALLLANYQFDRYRKRPNSDFAKLEIREIHFLVTKNAEKNEADRGIRVGEAVANAVCFARDLGNEPANVMTPSRMVEEARLMARRTGLKFEALAETELRRLKMGGILGVAKGSHETAHLVILEHRVRKPKRTICLVGKGVTFDSGGISLKPSANMEKMKYDMMGAAAVIASLKAIHELDLPFHVIGITPLCENLPSQRPQRPGDLVTAYNGKTVEVINTDAEGRLILMDALSYSEKFKPDVIIDLATLTGACAVTFSDKCIGLMGNDRKLVERVLSAGIQSGERCWELPLWEEYLDMIKGDIADLKNVGSGSAGTITAGKFLEQFVPKKTPWVHLDIAGVAWADSPKPFTPKGPTGAGIRLLVTLLREWK